MVTWSKRADAVYADKTGDRYHKGAGLTVFADGKCVGHADRIQRLAVALDATPAAVGARPQKTRPSRR